MNLENSQYHQRIVENGSGDINYYRTTLILKFVWGILKGKVRSVVKKF